MLYRVSLPSPPHSPAGGGRGVSRFGLHVVVATTIFGLGVVVMAPTDFNNESRVFPMDEAKLVIPSDSIILCCVGGGTGRNGEFEGIGLLITFLQVRQ